MEKREPDFFLSAAAEMRGELAIPRACWGNGRLKDHVRDDYMLIEIEPSLAGQSYGLGGKDITELIISTRLQGFSLFPVSQWPCDVYVARILDMTVTRAGTFGRSQVELIGWATIFRTRDEAELWQRRWTN